MIMAKKGWITEFKEFALKGNIIDVAIGMVIGVAFSAIITSLVNDIIMPLVGIVIGKVDFASLGISVGSAEVMYGSFIQACVNFFLIALTIFLCIKAVNRMRRKFEIQKETAAEEAPAALPEDIALLTEIRDLLKNK